MPKEASFLEGEHDEGNADVGRKPRRRAGSQTVQASDAEEVRYQVPAIAKKPRAVDVPRDAIRQSAGPVRTIVGLFYFFAGFWKFNTSFLDPKVSCACIYMASLMGMAPALPTQLANWAIRAAPLLTAGGELLLGACLLIPVHRARRVGVVLAAILHFTIAISRDCCPRRADGSPKYAYFFRCRCTRASTSCLVLTKCTYLIKERVT